LHLKYTKHLIAEDGEGGGKNRLTGREGKDIIVDVPLGTICRDVETGEVDCEIVEDGQEVIVAQGGRGGLGNDHFKSPTNQTPRYAQPGEEGIEAWKIIELKILADVGLVGFPNAGQGGTELYFTDEVLLLLREFDALNPYTKYKKEVVLRLKKDYSLDFYHLAKKHQTMGSFQISLDELFEQLGLPESYRRIGNLKDRVIKPSLEEITSNTDIDLNYENIKRGRSVIGFKFTVKEKPKPKTIETGRDEKTVDMFFKMSDAQINMFGNQLAQLPELSYLAVGNESYGT
jgi:hypothetical protein